MNGQLKKKMTPNWRTVYKSTLTFFLPAIALMGIIIAAILFFTVKSEKMATRAKELHTCGIQQKNIDADIGKVSSDLSILSHDRIFDRLWNDEGVPIPAVLDELESSFLNFAIRRRLYDQIRLLDSAGMELARVNYNQGSPAIVPDEKLQNKKGRYYFEDAFALNREEVYVSPLDLNIEHGQIEQPLKPMIRFATPVFDGRGTKRGVLLLNYFGSKLINSFVSISNPSEQSQPMLINADGYWMKGPNSENEWGFMYEERKELTFANMFPKEWERIKTGGDGQFETPGGLFTFATVYPLLKGQQSSTGSGKAYAPSARKLNAKEYNWKVVSHVPSEVLSAKQNSRLIYGCITLAMLSVILFWSSWRLAHAIARRKQAELELRTAYGQLEQLVEDRTKKLRRSEEDLRITLNSIGDAVIATNTQGHIVRMNQVAFDLTGYTFEEARGKALSEIFHIVNAKTLETVATPVRKVLDGDKIVTLPRNTMLISKDGGRYQITASGAPIRDADGSITGVVLVFHDVTEEEMTKKELLKVKKLESLGVLAGGIAHDFNNILTAILGNIELARFSLDSDNEVCSLLTDAEEASLRAKDLTRQLLTFSKGGDPAKKTNPIGKTIIESANFVLHGSPVSSQFSISDDLWLVDFDSGQISQVIQNLVLNSKHAMPEGGEIKINCANIVDIRSEISLPLLGNAFIKITVEDTGCGIAEKYMEKIFDPYFTTKQEGSGLGLAICHSIISKHNGHIAVQSKMGEGTTFTIYLPASENQIPRVPNKEADNPKTIKAKILIMDDEQFVQDISKQMLGRLGHEVLQAKNGREAIEIIKDHRSCGRPFDVIIMDLTIPGGMGGKDAIQEILKIDPDVKAVVASGYSNDPVMADYRQYGFKASIAKPFLLAELNRALTEAFS